ncbi:DedA family protein [Patescibacteria group bacterium]|nr:DedA family protein [Patescibacteria group bacterium]
MLEFLAHYIIQLIEKTNYFGIFILMTLESALIPIPSEVTMPFSGFLAAKGSLLFTWAVLIGALGNLVGSLLSYYIGHLLGETIILENIKKYGKFILVTEDDYLKATKWFKKYGNSIVFFSRLLPAIRTFISLPAGIFRMNIWKFSVYTLIGSLIWSVILTYIGFYLGENWKILGGYFRKFDFFIFIVILAVAVLYINHKLKIFGRKT